MRSSDRITKLFTMLALLLVMTFAVLVRTPHYYSAVSDSAYTGKSKTHMVFGCPEVRADKEGFPYFINMDGYYHVRIGDDLIRKGRFGDPASDGQDPDVLWDMLRRAPEGRSDKYHDGIVRAAVYSWMLLNCVSKGSVSPHAVFFWFSVLCSLLTAVAAFLLAKRAGDSAGASGNVSGVAAALLVSCAPAFVQRTLAGTFDTDMIQLLFTVILMLLITEALRAKTVTRCLLFAVGFGAVAAVFTKFWGSYSFAFALIGIIGGIIYVLGSFIKRSFEGSGRLKWLIRSRPLYAVLVSIVSTLAFATAIYGPSYLGSFAGALGSTANKSSTADLPNMFISISEMKKSSFGPSNPLEWLIGDISKVGPTTVNGSGGILVLFAASAALVVLAFKMITSAKTKASEEDVTINYEASDIAIYLSILSVWFVLCFYGTTLGVRFIEHFNAPVGILAGLAIGFLWKVASTTGTDIMIKRTIACLISASIVLPSAVGSWSVFPNSWGLATDAQESAMDWIVDNSENEDSVIASWWDLGYYYESASEHPTLWDGGEIDPVRAMIISKAFICEDPKLSRALLAMLSTSGNRCIDALREKLGNKDAFDALWKLAPASHDDTIRALLGYGFDTAEVEEIEALLHPSQPRETYVIVTTRMTRIVKWMKYFADWDFSGSPGGIESVGNIPDDAVIYRLYEDEVVQAADSADANGRGGPFTKISKYDDGTERVVIWKLN